MPVDVTTPPLPQADATRLQRRTCKLLGFSTLGLCALSGVTAYAMSTSVAFDFWHSLIASGLLLWGWRGGSAARTLANLALAIGMVYLAPLLFFAALLGVMPIENGDRDRLYWGLVYFSVLLLYYGVALALMRRANVQAKPAVPR